MYLSRLILNPADRTLRRELADVAAVHRPVMTGFGPLSGAARVQHGVLWRLDADAGQAPRLLIQSNLRPDWRALPGTHLLRIDDEVPNPAVKDLTGAWAAIANGTELVFRLRANA